MAITLPSPSLGSQHTVETFTVDEYTAGEMLLQVRPSTWGDTDIFKWSFERMTLTVKDALKTFLCTNAGKQITIQDTEARSWLGIVISKIIRISQTHRNTAPAGCPDNSLWVVEFEFEGDLQ